MSTLLSLLQSDTPLSYERALYIREIVGSAWAVARDSSLMGYAPARADLAEEILDCLGGLEILRAVRSGDLSERLWAGRAFARQPEKNQRNIEKILLARENAYVAEMWIAAMEPWAP
jgi:hypothetical protein